MYTEDSSRGSNPLTARLFGFATVNYRKRLLVRTAQNVKQTFFCRVFPYSFFTLRLNFSLRILHTKRIVNKRIFLVH